MELKNLRKDYVAQSSKLEELTRDLANHEELEKVRMAALAPTDYSMYEEAAAAKLREFRISAYAW